MQKRIESLYSEYLPDYRSKLKPFDDSQLRGLITNAQEAARQNYDKLSEPKSCSLDIYIEHWVRETLEKDLASRTLKKIPSKQNAKEPFLKALANYFYELPLQLLRPLNKEIYQAKIDERGGVWQNIDLPLEKIEKSFIKVATARNETAHQKNYSSYIDFSLSKYKIPRQDYERFTKNTKVVIDYLNRQLPKVEDQEWFYSEFSNTCFTCTSPLFPFKIQSEVINFIIESYPEIAPFKHKIKILDKESVHTMYKKEDDSFQITIDKNDNIRHQTISLVHEFGHVIAYLRNFKNEQDPLSKGKYLAEKEAIEIEISLMQKLGQKIYHAYFGEILLVLRRILFELELYKNPKQDLSRLYAKTYNHCFKKANQNSNPLYLLDERIIMSPLSSLPHAIAHTEIISNLME